MESDLIRNDFFLESTRTYLEKIFNIDYQLLMNKNFDEYVLKSLFIQKIPILRSILLSNKIVNMHQLLIPLMKQKYEMAQEKFQNLIDENLKLQEGKNIPLSSAKIKLIQFKILSEIQLAIFDYQLISSEKDIKKRKLIQNKITREFEFLIFNIQIVKEEDVLNENIVEEFFKKFICEMPDSYLIEDLLCEIFKNLEFDSEWINKFNDKCIELKKPKDEETSTLDVKEKEIGNYSSSLGKKRNFNKMQEETLDKKLRDEESLENNHQFSIKSKILKTIDTYFPKNSDREELGFKNVIKKISGGNSIMPIKDQNSAIRNYNYPANYNVFNKNSHIFPQSITPHSLMSEFHNKIHKEISDNNLNNVTLPSEDFDDSQGNIDSDKKKSRDKETAEKDTQDEAIDTHQENSIANINYTTSKLISDTFKSNDALHFNNFNQFNSSLSLSLNNANSYNKEHRHTFSDSNFKTDLNHLFNSNSKSINYSSVLTSGFKMNNLDSSFTSNMNDISSMTINNTRSNSNNMSTGGINSRLAGRIVHMPKAKKQNKIPSKSKKNPNEKIEEFFDKIQNKMKEEGLGKRKDSQILSKDKDRKNSDSNITVASNPLKKIIHNRFYLKEKDLKSPSPIQVECPKYSKRGKNIVTTNPNENIDLNHTSNTSTMNQLESTNLGLLSTSNTNSNMSSLEGRFDMLRNIKHNKSNASSNIKKSPDLSTGMSFNSVGECNNLIILNKIKNKAISANNDILSDDEILVLATPTKPCENVKFGRKSPNSAISSKVNLLNLFGQFKKNK